MAGCTPESVSQSLALYFRAEDLRLPPPVVVSVALKGNAAQGTAPKPRQRSNSALSLAVDPDSILLGYTECPGAATTGEVVFPTPVEMDYLFEQRQEITIRVASASTQGRSKVQYITIPVVVAHIVGSRGAAKTFELSEFGARQGGRLHVAAVATSANAADRLLLQLGGVGLAGGGVMESARRYVVVSRVLPNGTCIERCRSGPKDPQGNNNFDFGVCKEMPLGDLVAGTPTQPSIRVDLWIAGKISDRLLASCDVAFADLLASTHGTDNLNKAALERLTFRNKTKPQKSYGLLRAFKAAVTAVPTFIDFLTGGLEINLAVSIDFTGSNGDPRQPNSLHYMNPNEPNQYLKALMSVGDILMEYDTDKRVPVYGFGAVIPNTPHTSHFFNVNMLPDPYVNGVQGVVDAYGRCLPVVRFSGPTNFAPTINAVREQALREPSVYTILLIITDGEITDMSATMDAIVACDRAPLSIIIVGVGNGCDFQMMEELDGDDVRVTNTQGRAALRDLVQFVPFRDFSRVHPALLAAEVLREVPTQVEEWGQLARQVPGGWNGQHFDVASPPLTQVQSMPNPAQGSAKFAPPVVEAAPSCGARPAFRV